MTDLVVVVITCDWIRQLDTFYYWQVLLIKKRHEKSQIFIESPISPHAEERDNPTQHG